MSKIKIRKPAITIGKKGIRVQAPTARVGGKTGINLSKSGVSASHRGRLGTVSTKRGLRLKLPGCLLPALIILSAIGGALALLIPIM